MLGKETVLYWVAKHAYGGIFSLLVLGIVGLPVPDEFLLTYVGFLVFRGDLRIGPAIACAFFGTMCGITISFMLGRLLGLEVQKYGRYLRISPEVFRKTHDWFERIGKWSLTFGYFIPGVRHFTAYVAGTARLEVLEFALYAYTGAAFWVLTFISLGYFLGNAWVRVSERLHSIALIFTGVAVCAALAYFLWRKFRSRKS